MRLLAVPGAAVGTAQAGGNALHGPGIGHTRTKLVAGGDPEGDKWPTLLDGEVRKRNITDGFAIQTGVLDDGEGMTGGQMRREQAVDGLAHFSIVEVGKEHGPERGQGEETAFERFLVDEMRDDPGIGELRPGLHQIDIEGGGDHIEGADAVDDLHGQVAAGGRAQEQRHRPLANVWMAGNRNHDRRLCRRFVDCGHRHAPAATFGTVWLTKRFEIDHRCRQMGQIREVDARVGANEDSGRRLESPLGGEGSTRNRAGAEPDNGDVGRRDASHGSPLPCRQSRD